MTATVSVADDPGWEEVRPAAAIPVVEGKAAAAVAVLPPLAEEDGKVGRGVAKAG